ncbi:MAG: phosphoribosylaminoimidazolesuccinocarboxamide synthase [Nanoarchaeota archaeon]|nr:phosphoribosylaminoimidazolesuccinocarboxamide synthase [Nanoarchaeota archaeon]
MSNNFLTESEARILVEEYMEKNDSKKSVTTQEILDSGAVPRLKGYVVRPGKVSGSVFGGKGSFTTEQKNYEANKLEADHNVETFTEKVDGKDVIMAQVYFENPPVELRDGTPVRGMVRSEDISTHDQKRGSIPFKDQILAMNHNYMRKLAAPYIGTSQFEIKGLSDNSPVIAAENLVQISLENVMRAFMAKSSTKTSLYYNYMKGKRDFCGHKLPEGLIQNGPLPYVMDTPSTKSDKHDESVSPATLFKRGICTPSQYFEIRNNSLIFYGVASYVLSKGGIILVDTKLEHGISVDGKIKSQDEIITMDSSRFWLAKDYNEQMEKLIRGEITVLNPASYSKEFARGYSKGKEGYTQEQRAAIAVRYIMGVQELLKQPFNPDVRSAEERIVRGLELVVNNLDLKAA